MKNIDFNEKSILGIGEIMLRLSPPNYKKIIQTNTFETCYSGAEANVIISLSILGHKTKFLTKVPNNNLGTKVINVLKEYNVDTNDILVGDDRLGTYYVEMGYGLRSNEIIYDRKYSAISMAKQEEFDLNKILYDVKLVHLSGITPALSKDLKKLVIDIVKYCNKNNIKVSYDSNYRCKLWSKEEAREVLEEVLPYTDYCFLGYSDMVDILKFKNKNNELDFEENLKQLYKQLFYKYPNLKYASCTKRTLNSINNNTIQGYLFNNDKLFKSKEYTFDILDRVGSGDAFTAGILDGILNNNNNNEIVQFGTCACVLKHSIIGDINILDKEIINSFMNDNLKSIKR